MKKYTLVILCMCWALWAVGAQYPWESELSVLNMNDGLSDNNIHFISKDETGFMWFGTSDGLNRYDGHMFKSFRCSEPSRQHIQKIHPLDKDFLLLQSAEGLKLFDKRNERFVVVCGRNEKRSLHLTDWVFASPAQGWGIREDGLYRIDFSDADVKGDTVFVAVSMKKHFPGSILAMTCLSENGEGAYVVSEDGDIWHADGKSGAVTPVVTGGFDRPAKVRSVLNDKGYLWITTIKEGLYAYDLVNRKMFHWKYEDGKGENQLSHNDVFHVFAVGDSHYLATTWDGCTLISLNKDRSVDLQAFHVFRGKGSRYIETRMIAGFYDPEGRLWIGTEGGGVLYADLRESFYYRYVQKNSNEIGGIFMDDERVVWLATYHKGLMQSAASFDPGRPLSFGQVAVEKGEMNAALCISPDGQGGFWCGGLDGQVLHRSKEKEWRSFRLSMQKREFPVWSICGVPGEGCWMGTEKGLFWGSLRTGKCLRMHWNGCEVPDNVSIRAVTADRTGRYLFLGTEAGLVVLAVNGTDILSAEAGYEEHIGLLKEERGIRALLWGDDRKLWIGYGGSGLAVWSPMEKGIVKRYTTEQGLCSNFVTTITQDGEGSVWVGSNSGISRLSRHLQSFYNFYVSGSNRSSLFAADFLWWGNHSMLTYFAPSALRFNYPKERGRVVLTELEVNHSPVNIGEEVNGQVILQEALSYTGRVRLNNANRNLALSFTNLLYLSDLQKYLYRLYPYQTDWMMADEGEKILYDRLPPGEYEFQVKTIFQDQSEGEVTSLYVTVDPHWSETLWFRLIVLAVLVGSVGIYVHRLKLKGKRIQHELRLEHELFTMQMEHNKEVELRKERETFFAMAAHELRTPLTLILAPLKELISRSAVSDSSHGKLVMMYKYAEELHALTDRLLYMQKVEAGMVRLRLSYVNVVDLLNDVASGFVALAEERRIDYVLPSGEMEWYVWADREKLASALQNLISNAFKYTSAGGCISLAVSRKEVDGRMFCCLSVADTGKGIEENLRKHLFEPFMEGMEKPAYSSSMGLGLKIVKHTVEMHHGRITVESKVGEGSLFSIFLPEGKEHFEEDNCLWENEPEVRKTVDWGTGLLGKKENLAPENTEAKGADEIKDKKEGTKENTKERQLVLVIEDNRDMRGYLRELMREDYRVIEAENGEEGIRMAVMHTPDLIISDVMMPVMDGFACCAELRKRKETAHIPILILTAKAEDKDSVEAAYLGADEYIRKPFNPEVLLAKVAQLLDMRRRLKQIYTKTMLNVTGQEKDGKEQRQSEFMQKVLECIEGNAGNPDFNVKGLAGLLNMSQATLYRKLKQYTDLSAVELIRNVRMTQAALLLMETDLSVTEVAERVGFNDLPTFRKHFTGMFGVSPSKYADKREDEAEETEC